MSVNSGSVVIKICFPGSYVYVVPDFYYGLWNADGNSMICFLSASTDSSSGVTGSLGLGLYKHFGLPRMRPARIYPLFILIRVNYKCFNWNKILLMDWNIL